MLKVYNKLYIIAEVVCSFALFLAIVDQFWATYLFVLRALYKSFWKWNNTI